MDLTKSPPPDILLQAIGMLCFHISTHDDLVDEPPSTQSDQAALLYAGTIAALEGTVLLQRALKPEHAKLILGQINRNHLLQQRCVTELWTNRPTNFKEYYHGIEHDSALVGIGIRASLCYTNELSRWPQLNKFCRAYGTALQLLDDIAEVDEDQQSGYHSFPLLEGPPYTTSFKQIEHHIKKAGDTLDVSWHELRGLLDRVLLFKKGLQDA